MLTLEIPNFSSLNILERAKVAARAEQNQNSFRVDNPQNLGSHDYILIGTLNGGLSTIQQVLNVSNSTVTLTNSLRIAIEEGTDITRLVGNQIKVYRTDYVQGVTPAISDYAPVPNGTITIDPDQDSTIFTDPDGADQWYRYTYVNQYTGQESDLAASPASRDGGDSEYTTLDAVRDAAGFNEARYITNSIIQPHIDAAQSYVEGSLNGLYALPFKAPINPYVSDIVKRFAAGYLLLDQYKNNQALGQSKVDAAQKDLDRLVNKSVVLTGLLSENTTLPDAKGFAAWPNEETATTPGFNGGGERKYRVSDTQGYYGRKF